MSTRRTHALLTLTAEQLLNHNLEYKTSWIKHVSSLMTRIEMFVETSVCSSISHLASLLAQECFIEFSHLESFKLIIRREDVNNRLQKLSKYHKLHESGFATWQITKTVSSKQSRPAGARSHALLSNRYRRLTSWRQSGRGFEADHSPMLGPSLRMCTATHPFSQMLLWWGVEFSRRMTSHVFCSKQLYKEAVKRSTIEPVLQWW